MPVIGTVYLKVARLERLLEFYTNIIGLQIHREEDNTVFLGTGQDDLLALVDAPEHKYYPGTTGLYHFALLVPTRYELSRVLTHLIQTQTRIQGASDHIVSEAVYLADPEGNGIEIYCDRPREVWYSEGRVRLDTYPMNIKDVLSEFEKNPTEWTALHPETIMGHIHLHVASIPETRVFYTDMLELEVMNDVGSALFMAYDHYHHHIGTNIWNGKIPPPPNATGLQKFIFQVRDDAQRERVLTRLDEAKFIIGEEAGGYLVHDPAQNPILITP